MKSKKLSFFEGEGGSDLPPAPPPVPPPPGKTYTPEQLQAELNRLNADEKRKWQQKNQELATKLQELQQNVNLTAQEKEDLQHRIEDLQTTFQTKEQQATSELDKLQKRYDKDTKEKDLERENWKKRFEKKLISVDIYGAANKFEAYNPQQIEAIVLPITVVEEEQGEDGKPTGEFVTKVNFNGVDKAGKPVKLKLSVDDAVKMMTEMPQQYGNLFKNKAKDGSGIMPGTDALGNGKLADVASMTPQEYAKNRAAIHNELRKS